jgi:hypothetical protein
MPSAIGTSKYYTTGTDDDDVTVAHIQRVVRIADELLNLCLD